MAGDALRFYGPKTRNSECDADDRFAEAVVILVSAFMDRRIGQLVDASCCHSYLLGVEC
jgi:hypothetical protein